MSTYTEPPIAYQGNLEIHQENGLDPVLIVRKADERVAMARELWAHLVSVSYHENLMVGGGPCIHEDDKGLMVDIGTPDKGLGRVTYRVAETTRDWILCERIDNRP